MAGDAIIISFVVEEVRQEKRRGIHELVRRLTSLEQHTLPHLIPELSHLADNGHRAEKLRKLCLEGLRKVRRFRRVELKPIDVGRRNSWRRSDVVLYGESSARKAKEKDLEWVRLRREKGSTQVVEYNVQCDLCRTKIVLSGLPRSEKRWRRFAGLRSYKDTGGRDVMPTQLGHLQMKKSREVAAHQLCLDYAMGDDMIQRFAELPFEDHLDGFPIEAIKRLVTKEARKCVFCKKPGACTTCANKKCKNKDLSWYHLPCGQKMGSKQIPGEKKSLCPKHAGSLTGKAAKKHFKNPKVLKRSRFSIESDSPSKKRSRKCINFQTPPSSQDTPLYEQFAPYYDVSYDSQDDHNSSLDIKEHDVVNQSCFNISTIRQIDLPSITILQAIDLEEVFAEEEVKHRELEHQSEVEKEKENKPQVEVTPLMVSSSYTVNSVLLPINLKTEMIIPTTSHSEREEPNTLSIKDARVLQELEDIVKERQSLEEKNARLMSEKRILEEINKELVKETASLKDTINNNDTDKLALQNVNRKLYAEKEELEKINRENLSKYARLQRELVEMRISNSRLAMEAEEVRAKKQHLDNLERTMKRESDMWRNRCFNMQTRMKKACEHLQPDDTQEEDNENEQA